MSDPKYEKPGCASIKAKEFADNRLGPDTKFSFNGSYTNAQVREKVNYEDSSCDTRRYGIQRSLILLKKRSVTPLSGTPQCSDHEMHGRMVRSAQDTRMATQRDSVGKLRMHVTSHCLLTALCCEYSACQLPSA